MFKPLASRLCPELTIFSSLVLITFFIIASCTAHAFIYLDDLIVGFTSSLRTPDGLDASNIPMAISEYFLGYRYNILACYALRVFNVSVTANMMALKLIQSM